VLARILFLTTMRKVTMIMARVAESYMTVITTATTTRTTTTTTAIITTITIIAA
jgi:hypothetical protein